MTVYTDGFCAYDPFETDERHQREAVIHVEGEYVDGGTHVNTYESHASLVRRRPSPHQGIPKDKFAVYLRLFELRPRILRRPRREALKDIIQSIL